MNKLTMKPVTTITVNMGLIYGPITLSLYTVDPGLTGHRREMS